MTHLIYNIYNGARFGKRLLLMLLCGLTASVSFADEQEKVKLGDGHQSETVRLQFCNIFVTKGETDYDGNATVSLQIENLDESNSIVLFGHSYSEKQLKQLTPSITYDKMFGGSKGYRTIDTYQGINNEIMILPSEKVRLPDLTLKAGEFQSVQLPMYIAKYKNSKQTKMLLLAKQIIALDIYVDTRPDEDYARLGREYDELLEDISVRVFCTNPKHVPSLERQEYPYKDRIASMKSDIDSIIAARNWFSVDRGYMRYDSLKHRLDSIDFAKYERDCGKHARVRPRPVTVAKPSHRCRYCGLSLQQIYSRLDRYYRKLYTSKDRGRVKAQVMPDVETLYRCCTDAKCKNHASEWSGSSYRKKIETCYDRIRKM